MFIRTNITTQTLTILRITRMMLAIESGSDKLAGY